MICILHIYKHDTDKTDGWVMAGMRTAAYITEKKNIHFQISQKSKRLVNSTHTFLSCI